MESTSGRSSILSERHRSMVEARTTPLSRISHPGSAVDLILDRMGEIQANMGATHADTKESMVAIQADTSNSIEDIHADIGAVQANIIGVHANMDAVQAETQGALDTIGAFQAKVLHRLEHWKLCLCQSLLQAQI